MVIIAVAIAVMIVISILGVIVDHVLEKSKNSFHSLNLVFASMFR